MCTAQARLLLLVAMLTWPTGTAAQVIETVGTRAQGMANAFVGVADDASAVYWNPAGLAAGAFFSLLLDGGSAEAVPGGRLEAGRRSGWMLAASIPALGLAYYRIGYHAVAPVPPAEGPGLRRDGLVTHHVGATLVQSLTDRVAVGATLKGVRGIAGSAVLDTQDRDVALRHPLVGRSSTRFDVDAGIMATGAIGRVGVVARNLVDPGYAAGPAGVDALRLGRQVRAGGSVLVLPQWRLASDLDLTRQRGPFGDVREWALGSEAQLTSRLAARGGARINLASRSDRAPAVSGGASYAILGALMVDVQVTGGADPSLRGWGLAGRLVF